MSALLDDSPRCTARRGGATLDKPRGTPRRLGMPQRALGGVATTISEVLGPRETHAFGILMYHRITEPIPGRTNPTWNVPPERFRQQLEGLVDRGFVAWPLGEVVRRIRCGQPIPRNVFVMTFDDAYENVYLSAFPILRLFNLPATVFLATASLDSTEPLASDDWEEAGSGNVPYTTWRPLSTDECIEMQRSGLVELGAHIHTPGNRRGRPNELVEDLLRSQRLLRERFRIERASFAFRSSNGDDGLTGAELSAAAEKAGLLCALTNEARLVRPGDSPFDWGRFAAEEHDTAASLAAKLSGWYDAFRSLGHALLCRNPRRAAPPQRLSSDEETERN